MHSECGPPFSGPQQLIWPAEGKGEEIPVQGVGLVSGLHVINPNQEATSGERLRVHMGPSSFWVKVLLPAV